MVFQTIKQKMKLHADKAYLASCLWLIDKAAYADPIIPVSSDEQTTGNESFAVTMLNIVQKDILPIIEIFGGLYLLWKALTGIWSGFEDYQKTKEADRLKQAVINASIMIVVGGAILFMLDTLRSWHP